MNHRELGEKYLTLLEAVKHTRLSEAEVMLHCDEVWMFCPGAPDNEQVVKDTEAVAASSWLGIVERSGEMDMPVCAKLTDL